MRGGDGGDGEGSGMGLDMMRGVVMRSVARKGTRDSMVCFCRDRFGLELEVGLLGVEKGNSG